MSKPVNVYSISEVSQNLDENLPELFGRLGYTETFELVDQKLLIGYSIAFVAGVSFLIDKKFVHDDIVHYQQCLVVMYVILSVIFWYFKKYIEKSTVYTGKKDSKKVKVKTTFQDAEPLYKMTLIDNDNKTVEKSLEINKVFTEAGYLQSDLFLDWIKQQLATLDNKKE